MRLPLALALAAAAVTAARAPTAEAAQLCWGAIRWDSYYAANASDPGDPSAAVARTLRPTRWHDRLPWFANIDPVTGDISWDNTAPGVIEEELGQSLAGGLDHWVFDVYPPDSAMSRTLAAYLASTSPLKAQMSFALLLQSSWMSTGGLAAWPDRAALYSSHFARVEYKKIRSGSGGALPQPLLYIFGLTEDAWGKNTSWPAWSSALSMLANASAAAGAGTPYVVLQTWDAAQGAAQAAAINAAAGGRPLISALSAYALAGATDAGTPWAAFAASTASFWDALADTGMAVIPPVAAGWDNRPRNETPVPWQPHTDPAFVVGPTPEELGALAAAAAAWTRAHAVANPTGCHLLSAINEYDEGHWIGAVRPEFGGNARLEAIGSALRTEAAAAAASA